MNSWLWQFITDSGKVGKINVSYLFASDRWKEENTNQLWRATIFSLWKKIFKISGIQVFSSLKHTADIFLEELSSILSVSHPQWSIKILDWLWH